MNKFKDGDRVIFVNNPNGYTIAKNNPMVGTPYECEGTVIFSGANNYQVSWDNGSNNGYMEIDLDFAKSHSSNPNHIFKISRGKR